MLGSSPCGPTPSRDHAGEAELELSVGVAAPPVARRSPTRRCGRSFRVRDSSGIDAAGCRMTDAAGRLTKRLPAPVFRNDARAAYCERRFHACRRPPGPQGPIGLTGAQGPAGVSGYQLVSVLVSDVASDDLVDFGGLVHPLNCPAGKEALGRGVTPNLSTAQGPRLEYSGPSADGTGWQARLLNSSAFAMDVTVWVICASVPTSLW